MYAYSYVCNRVARSFLYLCMYVYLEAYVYVYAYLYAYFYVHGLHKDGASDVVQKTGRHKVAQVFTQV